MTVDSGDIVKATYIHMTNWISFIKYVLLDHNRRSVQQHDQMGSLKLTQIFVEKLSLE